MERGISRVFVTRAAGARSRGLLTSAELRIPCVLGRAGISYLKREGDGATPAGVLHPTQVLYRPDRIGRPDTALPRKVIGLTDGWCDDPGDRNYNRPVTLPYPGRHENLWRADRLYDLVVVLDWNVAPTAKGRGSAIFMHLAQPDRSPTEGCVAMAPEAMARLLKRLSPHTRIEIG